MTVPKARYKPTREQQRQFIKQYFPKTLPSEAARKLIAKNDPNFTEASLFKFLATDGFEPEFAIYCWLRAMKHKFDLIRHGASTIDKPDFVDRSKAADKPDFDTPEPSSFAPQTASPDNWLNATIAQDLHDIDCAATEPQGWDLRHWMAIVLAIEVVVGCGYLAIDRIITTKPDLNHIQSTSQKPQ